MIIMNQKEEAMIEMRKRPFAGFDECIVLSNRRTELIISIEAGPRVLFFGRPGGQNLFRIFDEEITGRPHEDWQSYGGHRLWHAPEVFPRTYFPDNDPVAYNWDGRTLRLRPVAEENNGLQKEIDITLDPEKSTVDLDHHITNTGPWSKKLAAWCLSVMAPGGEAVIPQEEYRGHPEYLVPARPLVLWHFTRMNDPRFTWGDRFILMREDSRYDSKQKIGIRSRPGWAAYRLNHDLFIKLHDFDEQAEYADMGSNAEFFTMPGFLEIETLSPLTELEPGETLTHRERWGLFDNFEGSDEKEINEKLSPLAEGLKEGFRRHA
jgi:hypothetical protein